MIIPTQQWEVTVTKRRTISDSKNTIDSGERLDERIGVIEISDDDFHTSLGEG